MRKRFTFLWVASALVITLALPASTFAAQPIFYRSISIGCPSYPQTDIQMVLRFVAKASSGADRMKVRAWVSQSSDGVTWSKVYHWPQVDYSWIPDGTRHFVDVNHTWPDSTGYQKIVVHLQAYSGDHILWGGKVHTAKC